MGLVIGKAHSYSLQLLVTHFWIFVLAVLFLFALSWREIASQASCNYARQIAVGELFTIASPGYTSGTRNYPANSHCSWMFTTPVGNHLGIYCSDFTVSDTNCANNVFALNGARYCSNGIVSGMSPKNQLKVTLDSRTAGGRFYCTVSAKPNECDCGRRHKVSGRTQLFCWRVYFDGNYHVPWTRLKSWEVLRRSSMNSRTRPTSEINQRDKSGAVLQSVSWTRL